MNAAILLSAWSAAASDIYISSRFLFFLARRGHAPNFLAHLFRYPRSRRVRSSQSDSDSDRAHDSGSDAGGDSDGDSDVDTDADTDADGADDPGRQPSSARSGLRADELLGGEIAPRSKNVYVMPLASVLVSSSVGLLTFMSFQAGSADVAFSWLISVTSVASLQSWAGMLFTYIRCV